MKAVVAAQGEQADVGDHQPLRGPIFVAVRVFLGRFGGHDVDARLRVAQDLVDRNRGGDLLVALAAGQRQSPLPNRFPGSLGDVFEIVAVQQIGDAAIFDLLQQVAVVDAQHPQPRRVEIDADQRQLLAAGFRQHVGRAAKTQSRLAIFHAGGEILAGSGLLAGRGRNAGPRLDRVALAVRHAFHAELWSVGADDRLDGGLDDQIVLVMNLPALGEVIGELEADFGGRAVRFDLDALDLEGVGVRQLLIPFGDAGVVLQLQRLSERGDGFFRLLVAVVQLAQPEQGAGALVGNARRLKSVPGGLLGSLLGALASFFVVLGRFRPLGLPRLTQGQPGRGLVGAGDDRGFVAGDGGGPILLPRLLVGLLQ